MDDILTKQETAKYLKISIRQVEYLVSERKLIKSKQGRNIVFKKENILKYVGEYVKDV